jgi:hypothetical protein
MFKNIIIAAAFVFIPFTTCPLPPIDAERPSDAALYDVASYFGEEATLERESEWGATCSASITGHEPWDTTIRELCDYGDKLGADAGADALDALSEGFNVAYVGDGCQNDWLTDGDHLPHEIGNKAIELCLSIEQS